MPTPSDSLPLQDAAAAVASTAFRSSMIVAVSVLITEVAVVVGLMMVVG